MEVAQTVTGIELGYSLIVRGIAGYIGHNVRLKYDEGKAHAALVAGLREELEEAAARCAELQAQLGGGDTYKVEGVPDSGEEGV